MGFFPYFWQLTNLLMKKILLLALIGFCFVAFCFISAVHKIRGSWDHDISIRVKETDDVYQLSASYDREKTGRLQRYMDDQLNAHHLFHNSRMDAEVTLDDKTIFYVKTSPGKLLIKFDKHKNDEAACARMKGLGEHIKEKLTENQ
jgi:hypothetical protein